MSISMYTIHRNDRRTPKLLFKWISRRWGPFDLDPATDEDNWLETPNFFFTPKEDGLKREWFGKVYVNPPYGRDIIKWLKKAFAERMNGHAERVVFLLPARTDTTWFHKYIFKLASEIVFLQGRAKFVGARYPAPFVSVIVVFGDRGDDRETQRVYWN